MANTTRREHCKRCKVEVTAAQKRMPKLVKAREAKCRTQKFQAFDVDEVMARHLRLIENAINRGYSVKALTGLVRAAEDAYQLARA